MSFNDSVKTEIINNLNLNDSERNAFVSAILRAGSIGIVRGRLSAEIPVDVADIAPRLISILKEAGADAEIEVRSSEQGVKRYVTIAAAARLLDTYKIIGMDGKSVVKLYSGIENVNTDEEKRAYVIGYFLVAGSVSIPSFELTSSKNG